MFIRCINWILILVFSVTVSAEESYIAAKVEQSVLLDIARLSDQRLVAVGERGHVLLSTDNGLSWKQVKVPTTALLTAVTFVNEQIGYAVGHHQVILKSNDGGESWELQHKNSEDVRNPAFLDVWFRDGMLGYAAGAYGLFFKTVDGGANWEFTPLTELENPEFGLPHIYSLTFDGHSNSLLMAGELGFLAISKNFGENWEMLESPYEGSFFNISVSPTGSLHLMGLRGHLFRSTDQAESWEEIETGTTASLNSMVALGGNKLMYFGVDGVMLISEDDGASIRVAKLADRPGLMAGNVIEPNKLVVVGDKGFELINFDGKRIER